MFDGNYLFPEFITLCSCTIYRLIKDNVNDLIGNLSDSSIDNIINIFLYSIKRTKFTGTESILDITDYDIKKGRFPVKIIEKNELLYPEIYVSLNYADSIISDLLLLKSNKDIKRRIIKDINDYLLVRPSDIYQMCKEIFKDSGYDIEYNKNRGATIKEYNSALKDNVWKYRTYYVWSYPFRGVYKCTGIKYYIPSVYNTGTDWCLEFENVNIDSKNKLYCACK